MADRPTIALAVPFLAGGGGVPSVARFLVETAERSGAFDVRLVSLAVSAQDELSSRVLSPRTWTRGAQVAVGSFEGRPMVHVGSVAAEFEPRRYAPRRPLTEAVRGCALVQVVAGSPAWAAPFATGDLPVSLQVASLVAVERRARDLAAGGGPRALWRRAMTSSVTRIERRALGGVAAIQVENQWMLDHVSAVVRPGVDLRLAPPGVDATTFIPMSTPEAPRYVLCVGRLDDPRKRVELLAAGFAAVAARFPDVRLITAGSGEPPPAFWSLVRSHGLEGRVRHVTSPTQEELIRLYQGASIFALASDEEGLGVVLLEAMACGVPVVSTRSGGPDSLIEDGVNGFLVARDDAAALADRIAALLADDVARREMGRRARRTVDLRYSSTVAGDAFLDVWSRLASRVA